MKTTTHLRRWRSWRPNRAQVVLTVVSLAACVVYFAALHLLDGRAESYFRELRDSNPPRYLTLLRESRGFDAFLEEYRQIEGFDEFRHLTPIFLVGRWTMQPAPIRLTPGTAPKECINPVTFDYGLYLQLENGDVALPVSYRIAEETVEMRTTQLGTIPITLISYGGHLDHIEFVPPRQTEIVYAYLCGR